MRISCHLIFDGQCKSAFTEYRSILGGTVTTLITFGESPLADQVPSEWAARVLHATLAFEDQEILGSDAFPGEPCRPQGFAVTLSTQDPAWTQAVFDRFARAGIIKMPLQQTFWARLFGVVTDRFGVTWELNCAHA
jgi:PhnB protein